MIVINKCSSGDIFSYPPIYYENLNLSNQGCTLKTMRPKPWEVIKAFVHKLRQKIWKPLPHKIRDYVPVVVPIIKTAIQAGQAVAIASEILHKSVKVQKAVSNVWKNSSFLNNALKYVRFLGTFQLPLHAVKLGFEFKKLITGNADQRKDAAIICVSHSGSILYNVATLVKSLNYVGAVPYIAFASPLAIVGTVLSVANAVASARGWYQSAQFLKKFNNEIGGKKAEYSVEECFKALHFVKDKDDYTIKKHYCIKNQKLRASIEKIEAKAKTLLNSTSTIEQAEGKTLLNKTVVALRQRVKRKIGSEIMAVVIGIVSFVAMIVLLLTPIAPLGLALMAASGGVGIAGFFYKRRADNLFLKALDTRNSETNISQNLSSRPPKVLASSL